MSNELSIDEKLKLAQIKKIESDIESTSKFSWIEFIKLFGVVIVGVGGFAGAYTQYEVAELKAQRANKELSELENKKTEAQNAIAKLEEELKKKESLIKETQNKTIPELKRSLNQATFDSQENNPELAKKRLVYVQFQGSTKREFIDELRGYLERESFNAPGAERRAGNYTSEVRYFPTLDKVETNRDEADAKRLAKAVENFYATKGCQLNLPVEAVPINKDMGKKSPPEVWLADEDFCK